MVLTAFLKNPTFLHDREAMLMHKLIYDCRLAFAEVETRLQVLTGEVDHDGFDVMLDDGDTRKQFQVKTVYGKASTWKLHRRLLRPTSDEADNFAYESSPAGIGIGGGFILQELAVSPTGGMSVKYYYTDLFILRAFDLDLLHLRGAKKDRKAGDLFHALERGHGTIAIPKCALFPAKDAVDLLALAGFNTARSSLWRFWLKGISALKGGFVLEKDVRLPGSEAYVRGLITEKLTELRAR
jgi:hypothetical protein